MRPVKIGHWGGMGGQPCDLKQTPHRLVRVIVYRNACAITAIEFTYADSREHHHDEGPWGGDPDNDHTRAEVIELHSGYLKEVSGTHGQVGSMRNNITSLRFVTNTNKVYAFGQSNIGTPFEVPIQDGKIVGFFGRAGDYLDSLGIYCA
ncbi:unnamed protein product [Urochloa decumbens]|uniref:Jacalin-type lectin domain-containing protein n=1 Tax=Urochloa decumbens TaxID=240449 RepID=A0ABC9AL71_9POAL